MLTTKLVHTLKALKVLGKVIHYCQSYWCGYFTRMVHKAKEYGLITGLISHIIPNGVAILQYADDTIIFLKHDLSGAIHMKLLLYLFEMLAGLKINFNMSEILMINDDESWGTQYADIFNCQVGLFPIKYLGGPVNPSRLKVID